MSKSVFVVCFAFMLYNINYYVFEEKQQKNIDNNTGFSVSDSIL
jgi:hypothetical protein